MTSTENIKSGLQSAFNSGMDVVQFFINVIIVPGIVVAALVFLIFHIFRAAKKHQQHEPFEENITMIIVAVAVIALVGSFPLWGWQMLGLSGGASTASITTAVQLGVW